MDSFIDASLSRTEMWIVAAALPSEFAPLMLLQLPNVDFLETGMGARNAARAIRRAIENDRPGGVIHIGYAGALTSSLAVGDVVIADRVDNLRQVAANADLLQVARNLQVNGVSIRTGAIFTYDRILTTAKDKQAIAAKLAVGELGCVDMESAVVASACGDSGIPYLGIRCITDAFHEDLPVDFNECRGENGNISVMRVLWATVRRPASIFGLIELQRRSRHCAGILCGVVDALIVKIPRPV